MSGMWSEEEQLLHINLLEMKALFLALQSFWEIVTGRRVTAMCNNSTVVAYVNKQDETVSRSLCSLASRLFRWTESLDIHLDARYLPGQSNVLADLLSCQGQVIGTEWSLHPLVARALLRVWGSRRSTCSLLTSTQSCPYTAPSSRIPRWSARMRFAILGTTWTFACSHPFLSSEGWWPGSERLPISP